MCSWIVEQFIYIRSIITPYISNITNMFNEVGTLFSTREIASILWIIIIIILMLMSKDIRKSIIDVIEAVMSRYIIVPTLIIISYGFLFIYLTYIFGVNKPILTKEILQWVLIVGIPLCFNSVNKNVTSDYFKYAISNNFELTVFFQFFISTFTFNLILEMILLPVFTFLVMLDTYVGINDDYKLAKKFTAVLIGIFILYGLAFTIRRASIDYVNLDELDTFISFIIPIVLSILYVPIAFLLCIYSKYEQVFKRMKLYEPKNKLLQLKHRVKVFRICLFSLEKINKFYKEGIKLMYKTMSDEEFDIIINGVS